MLQLNVAPSPNPAALQPSAGPAAQSQSVDGIAAGNANSQADSQFASVLKDQIKRASDSKAAQAGNARNEAAAAADAPLADAPVDALALLAPMLAGLVPAKSPAATPAAGAPGSDDKSLDASADGTQTQGGDPAALGAAAIPVALATPAVSAAPASGAAKSPAATVLASETPETPSVQAQPKAGTALPATANLAAAAATAAESSAETGKPAPQPESFQSLLNAANDAQAMAGHQAAAQRAAAAPAASTTVTTPMGSHGWDNEVGEKVTWMVGRQETRAELVLNPPEFGRIEVSLSLKGDQANAVFTSANPAVREALENAMPRLRELLQDAGISLGQSQVGAESFRQSANQRENGDNPRPGQGRDGGDGRSMPTGAFASGGSQVQWLRRGSGMIDTFA